MFKVRHIKDMLVYIMNLSANRKAKILASRFLKNINELNLLIMERNDYGFPVVSFDGGESESAGENNGEGTYGEERLGK